jgi:hypothetical protein
MNDVIRRDHLFASGGSIIVRNNPQPSYQLSQSGDLPNSTLVVYSLENAPTVAISFVGVESI